MQRRRFLSSILAASLGGPGALHLFAQARQDDPDSAPLIRPAAVPNSLRIAAKALGDRVSVKGKERFLLTGTITEGRDKSAGRILYELPGKVRVEWTGASRSLTFDGKTSGRSDSSLTKGDRGVLESLAEDMPEAFFDGLNTGAALRFVGARFRIDDGTTPNYQGPWLTLYSYSAPAKTSEKPAVRTKQFMFDSVTGLLNNVRYVREANGVTTGVITYFTWMDVGGQRLPRTITRSENGVPVFAFQAASGDFGPGIEDGVFSTR